MEGQDYIYWKCFPSLPFSSWALGEGWSERLPKVGFLAGAQDPLIWPWPGWGLFSISLYTKRPSCCSRFLDRVAGEILLLVSGKVVVISLTCFLTFCNTK